jgi:hypothetical protein
VDPPSSSGKYITCIYICTYVPLYLCSSVWYTPSIDMLHIYIHTCMHTYIHVYIYIYHYVSMHVRVRAYVRMCVCIVLSYIVGYCIIMDACQRIMVDNHRSIMVITDQWWLILVVFVFICGDIMI